jgi:hypothetical protein
MTRSPRGADADQLLFREPLGKQLGGGCLVRIGRQETHKIALNREHIERALFPGLVTADGQASVMRPHEYRNDGRTTFAWYRGGEPV